MTSNEILKDQSDESLAEPFTSVFTPESVLDSPKLLRLSAVVDIMYAELRRLPLDGDPGAVDMVGATLRSIKESIPDMVDATLALESDTFLPSVNTITNETEARMALARLAGWFNGILMNLRTTDPALAALANSQAAIQAAMDAAVANPASTPATPEQMPLPGYI